MKSKTTITVETVKQIRIRHASAVSARPCPFCGAETLLDHQTRESIACEIVESILSTEQTNDQISRSENNE